MLNFNLDDHFNHDDVFLLPINIVLGNEESFSGFYTNKKIDTKSLYDCGSPFELYLYEFRMLDKKLFLEDVEVDYGFHGSFLTYENLEEEAKGFIKSYKEDLKKYIHTENANMYFFERLNKKWYIEIKDIQSTFHNIKELKYGKNNY